MNGLQVGQASGTAGRPILGAASISCQMLVLQGQRHPFCPKRSACIEKHAMRWCSMMQDLTGCMLFNELTRPKHPELRCCASTRVFLHLTGGGMSWQRGSH